MPTSEAEVISQMVMDVNFINRINQSHRTSFVRIKISNKDLLITALVDSGNLAHTLCSYSFAKSANLPILPSDILLRSPNQKHIDVVGKIEELKFFIENVPCAIIVRDLLVVRDLAYPLNLGRGFLSDERAQLDFSQSPGYLQLQGVKIPLNNGKLNLLEPSTDFRFKNTQDKLRDSGIHGESLMVGKKVKFDTHHVEEKSMASSLTKPVSPNFLPDVNRKCMREVFLPCNSVDDVSTQAERENLTFSTTQTIPPNIHNSTWNTPDRRGEQGRELQGEPAKTDSLTNTYNNVPEQYVVFNRGSENVRVKLNTDDKLNKDVELPQNYTCNEQIQYLCTKYNTYNKDTVHIPAKTAILTKISTVPLPSNRDILFIPDASRKYFIERDLLALEGVYKTNTEGTNILLCNLGEKDVVLPAGLKLGSVRVKEEGVSMEVHNLNVDHTPKNKLTPKQLNERRKYVYDNLKLKENKLLNEKQKYEIVEMFVENFDCVSLGEDDLGYCDLVKCDIKLEEGATPVAAKCRPLNPSQIEDLREQIDAWKRAKIIEPSVSPWAAALVPVRKKDSGKIRWTQDFRALNKVTITDPYPLPNIENNLQNLSGSNIFSTLDISNAFHCIEMTDRSKPLTAFTSPLGTFQFTRMAFGLKNAPGVFSRLIRLALQHLPASFVLSYMDDVLVFSGSIPDHILHLRQVLQAHVKYGLKLRLSKCNICTDSVDYLGHTVSKKGIQMKKSYIDRILDWPPPQSPAQLRSFLGTVGYYRRFIPDFAILTADMDAQRNKRALEWTLQMDRDFDKLKKLFAQSPIRAYPDFRSNALSFVLETDWSHKGKGAVLLQKHPDGVERFIGVVGAKNNSAERNYSANKGELCAIVYGLRKFDTILSFKKFILRTDSMALTHLHNLKEVRGIFSRWRDVISMFDFEIEHKKGKDNIFADSISRRDNLPVEEDRDSESEEILDVYQLTDEIDVDRPGPITKYTMGQLLQAIQQDVEMMQIIDWVRLGYRPTAIEKRQLSKRQLSYVKKMDDLYVKDGCLYLDVTGESQDKLCVPDSLIKEVVKTVHDATHVGMSNTIDVLRQFYFWPGMVVDTQIYVDNCVNCLQKRNKPFPKHHIQHREMIGRFGMRLYIDTVGPLTPSKFRGEDCRHFLTMQDGFTRYLVAVPVPNLESTTLIDALIEGWINVHSVPEEIFSDRGRSFLSGLMKELNKVLDVRHVVTPPYSPESNRVERAHRTLGNLMRSNDRFLEVEWPKKLATAVFVYNTMKNRITGVSPYFAVFGREPQIPARLLFDMNLQNDTQKFSDYIEDIKNRFQQIHQKMVETQRTQVQKEIDRDERDGRGESFNVGDQVYIFSAKSRPGVSLKLQRKWLGPYHVEKIISPSLLLVSRIGVRGATMCVIVNRVKKITSDQEVEWGPELPFNDDLMDEIDIESHDDILQEPDQSYPIYLPAPTNNNKIDHTPPSISSPVMKTFSDLQSGKAKVGTKLSGGSPVMNEKVLDSSLYTPEQNRSSLETPVIPPKTPSKVVRRLFESESSPLATSLPGVREIHPLVPEVRDEFMVGDEEHRVLPVMHHPVQYVQPTDTILPYSREENPNLNLWLARNPIVYQPPTTTVVANPSALDTMSPFRFNHPMSGIDYYRTFGNNRSTIPLSHPPSSTSLQVRPPTLPSVPPDPPSPMRTDQAELPWIGFPTSIEFPPSPPRHDEEPFGSLDANLYYPIGWQGRDRVQGGIHGPHSQVQTRIDDFERVAAGNNANPMEVDLSVVPRRGTAMGPPDYRIPKVKSKKTKKTKREREKGEKVKLPTNLEDMESVQQLVRPTRINVNVPLPPIKRVLEREDVPIRVARELIDPMTEVIEADMPLDTNVSRSLVLPQLERERTGSQKRRLHETETSPRVSRDKTFVEETYPLSELPYPELSSYSEREGIYYRPQPVERVSEMVMPTGESDTGLEQGGEMVGQSRSRSIDDRTRSRGSKESLKSDRSLPTKGRKLNRQLRFEMGSEEDRKRELLPRRSRSRMPKAFLPPVTKVIKNDEE